MLQDQAVPLNELGEYLVKNAPKMPHISNQYSTSNQKSAIQMMIEEPISHSDIKESMLRS